MIRLLKRVKQRFGDIVTNYQTRFCWTSSACEGIRKRVYRDYTQYEAHQKSKLKLIKTEWLKDYDIQYRKALRQRLKQHACLKQGMSVLCLGARIGTEVKSFMDLGCFAAGIDLNPGLNNAYVLYGDFHELQFPDQCVDVVFTNALDHVLKLDRLIQETGRVLKPGGCFIADLNAPGDVGGWESLCWNDYESLYHQFKKGGFRIESEQDIDFPWKGKHVRMIWNSDPDL